MNCGNGTCIKRIKSQSVCSKLNLRYVVHVIKNTVKSLGSRQVRDMCKAFPSFPNSYSNGKLKLITMNIYIYIA